MDSLQTLFSKLSMNKVHIEIVPNRMNELSVFKTVSPKTEFTEFDDVLSVFKSIRKHHTIPVPQPKFVEGKQSTNTPVEPSFIATPQQSFLASFFHAYGFSQDITLFLNDASLLQKLSKLQTMIMDALDISLVKKLKYTDCDIRAGFTIDGFGVDLSNFVPLATYVSHLKQTNTAIKINDAYEFITVNTSDSYVDIEDTAVTYHETGLYARKLSIVQSRYKNLKQLLVKDLKHIAQILTISTTKTVDGKKISLHKQELLSEIEAKVSFT